MKLNFKKRALQIVIAGCLPAMLLFTGCHKTNPWGITGKGESVTIQRNAESFNAICLEADVDITYKKSPDYRMEISGQSNILHVLETEVRSNVLKVSYKRNVWKHRKVTMTVYAPVLVKVSISGSGSVVSTDSIGTNNLDLKISGSGNISLPAVKLLSLSTHISGSGNITLDSGTVSSSEHSISGSGDIDCLGVTASQAFVKISGSGNVSLNVTESMDVHISGSGDVKYKGRPSINLEMSGSGKLIRIN